MKRVSVILSFFMGLFGVICLTGCEYDSNASLTVGKKSCNGCGYSYEGMESLEGCHIKNSWLDCYYFPTACGYYDNVWSATEYYSCMPPSCVLFGFDFTLLECYGDDWENRGTDTEQRTVIQAQEAVDYTIDKITVVGDGSVYEFSNGTITEDIWSIIKWINVQEAVNLQFYVEYTALTELHSATLSADFVFDDFMSSFHDTGRMEVTEGNVKRFVGESNLKSRNIKAGKHILTASVSLNMYEAIALEGIENFAFTAYTYYDDGEE